MFGGGIVWFYRVLAGMNIDPAQPGYRHIIFKPQPAGDLTFVSYSNETPLGKASVRWERNAGPFKLDVEVPVGSTATVYVPTSDPSTVTESGKKIKDSNLMRFQKIENGYAMYVVASGKYTFESQR